MPADWATDILESGYSAFLDSRLWDKFLVEQPEKTSFEQYKKQYLNPPKKRKKIVDKENILETAEKAREFFKKGGR